MARAPSLAEFEFVLPEDLEGPPEDRTTWRLRPLKFAEYESVMRLPPDRELSEPEVARRMLNLGLLGWENFLDQDGHPIPFRKVVEGGREVLPEELLDAISAPRALILYREIDRRSRLTKEAAKNS